MSFDVIIDGTINLSSKKVYMPYRPAIPANKKKIEYVEIPGRSGALTVFNGYQDRTLELPFNFYDKTNVNKKMRTDVSPIMLNAKTIKFSDDPDIFYKVKNVEIDDLDRKLEVVYSYTANVTIEPFNYSVNGSNAVTITKSSSITNSGTYFSEPKITLYGNGNLSVTINSYTFQVNNVSGSVIVDSDLKMCYAGGTTKTMTGVFPKLDVGANKIKLSSNITKAVIVPNWRYL